MVVTLTLMATSVLSIPPQFVVHLPDANEIFLYVRLAADGIFAVGNVALLPPHPLPYLLDQPLYWQLLFPKYSLLPLWGLPRPRNG